MTNQRHQSTGEGGAERYVDLMRQGFMRLPPVPRQKQRDDAAFGRACAARSRKAYAEMWGEDWSSQA